jgi:competence protein ComEC
LVLDLIFKKDDLLPILVLVAAGIGFIFPPLTTFSIHSEDLSVYADQGAIRLIAEVVRPPQHDPNRVRLEMGGIKRLTGSGEQPIHGSFRVTILQPETSLAYGDRVEMTVQLRRFRQFENPGSFLFADYLERQGLVGQVTLQDERAIKITQTGQNTFLRGIYRYRDAIRKKILADLHTPVAPILLAMVIGESGFLTDDIRDIFTASGTVHILSISGSHLTMISFFVFGLSRWFLLRLPASLLLRLSLFKIPSQWAALITAMAVTFYALLSGMAVATERSLIMIVVYLFAIWIGRANDIKIALSLAATFILVRQPQAIFDISFQLSFAAILFIILTIDWYRDRQQTDPNEHKTLEKYITRPVGLLLMTSIAATLGTAPLTLYHFHQLSWVGVIANLTIVPLTGFIVLPLGLTASVFSPLLNAFPLATLHDGIGSFYFKVTAFFANLPGADVHFASPSLFLVALFYAVLPLLFIKRVSRLWIGATIAAFFIVFLGWGSFRLFPKNLRVTFLDVGQGDGALIEFPRGSTMLVDAGSGQRFDIGKTVIAPFLWEKKIRAIDYLIGTHPQEDHMGGFSFLVQQFKIGHVLTNGMDVPLPFYRSFLKTLSDKGITPRGVSRATPPMRVDGCQIVFVNPSQEPDFFDRNLNNHSVVFRLSCPDISTMTFLFTGDIEDAAMQLILKNGALSQNDIIKVPHHGSRSSLDADFLKRVSPRVAVFSAGKRNPYGHPHPRALAAYKGVGAAIYRTDQDGAVTVTVSPGGLNLKTFRESRLNKVQLSRLFGGEEISNIQKVFETRP